MLNYQPIKKEIEQQDWNAEWEKSYPAVLINNYCYVHAHFPLPH